MSTFTAQQVCNIISNDDLDDPEYLFSGSDDDLGMSDDEDVPHQDEWTHNENTQDSDLEPSNSCSPPRPSLPHSSLHFPSLSPSSSLPHFQSPSHSRSRSRSRSPLITVSPSLSSTPRGRSRGRGRGRGQRQIRGRGSGRGRTRGRRRNNDEQSSTPASMDPADEEWSTNATGVIVNNFTKSVGPTFSLSSDPLDVFLHLFPPHLIDMIVAETNRYATECLQLSYKGDGPVPTWVTNAEEIKAFLGFSILMGVNVLPDTYDYWSLQETFHYFPIASRISRKRFLEIRRFLHFVDNSTLTQRREPEYDRLGKIRPVINAVNAAFLTSYHPNCENSIDEAMIKFKGRSSLKQYLPLKPVKRGLKAWVRADARNGIMCELSVYTGKESDQPETNLGAKVVKKLTRNTAGDNHHIYCDNYFTSVQLFEELLQEDSTYACGTFRRDRKGIPQDIKNAGKYVHYHTVHEHPPMYTHTPPHSHKCTKVLSLPFLSLSSPLLSLFSPLFSLLSLSSHTHTHTHLHTHTHTHLHIHTHTHTPIAGLKRGESIFRQKDNLVACVWQDKRQVYVMSTNSQATGTSTVRRKQKDGTTTTLPCPPNVVMYNKFMGGVDHHDQYRSYYKLRSKSRKFYTYIFWFLLDACIINTFLLSRHFGANTQSKLSHIKHFRVKLAEALVGSYSSRQKYSLPAKVRETAKQPGCKPPRFSLARDPTRVASGSLPFGQGHFPVKGKSSRCHYCWNYQGNRRHESTTYCQVCGYAFCVVPRDVDNGPTCFETYHCKYLH